MGRGGGGAGNSIFGGFLLGDGDLGPDGLTRGEDWFITRGWAYGLK